jgi:hypothetical protein
VTGVANLGQKACLAATSFVVVYCLRSRRRRGKHDCATLRKPFE